MHHNSQMAVMARIIVLVLRTPGATTDRERWLFEAWFSRARLGKGASKAQRLLAINDHGDYVDDSSQRHWWTWQAARAVSAREVPAVWVLTAPDGTRFEGMTPFRGAIG